MLGHLEAMKDGYCFTLWTRQIMLEARLVSGLELGSPSATLSLGWPNSVLLSPARFVTADDGIENLDVRRKIAQVLFTCIPSLSK